VYRYPVALPVEVGSMEFTRLHLGEEPFSPEELELLSTAFERAWDTVVKSGAKFSGQEIEMTRDLLAKRIIEIARQGERDVAWLVNDALEHLTRPMSNPKPLIPD
jgi:hypothetical protein